MSLSDPPSVRTQRSRPAAYRTSPKPRQPEEHHGPGRGALVSILTIGVGLLFLAYVFNVGGLGKTADSYFASLDQAAKNQTSTVVLFTQIAAPYVGILGGLLVFLGLLHVFYTASQARKGRR